MGCSNSARELVMIHDELPMVWGFIVHSVDNYFFYVSWTTKVLDWWRSVYSSRLTATRGLYVYSRVILIQFFCFFSSDFLTVRNVRVVYGF